uniref:Uncharacterized protein n=1 Tax=Meloidogyne floridensis TaxID=298350 RepID=A0A915P406_9BILA
MPRCGASDVINVLGFDSGVVNLAVGWELPGISLSSSALELSKANFSSAEMVGCVQGGPSASINRLSWLIWTLNGFPCGLEQLNMTA